MSAKVIAIKPVGTGFAAWWLLLLTLAIAFATSGPTRAAAPAAGTQAANTVTLQAGFGTHSVHDDPFEKATAAFKAGQTALAVSLWRPLAERGHIGAQFNLGIAYATGQGVARDPWQAMHWWRAAAHQGHRDAQYNLGLLYAEGDGVDKDVARALMWWYMAGIRGDAAAQFQLGAFAVNNPDGTQNLQEAAWWWRRAAAQGFEHAITALEILRTHGVLIETVNKP